MPQKRSSAGRGALVRQSEAQQQQIAEREGQYQSAVAAVDHAKAQLEIAKLQLSCTEIRAPIVGVATQKTVQLGDHVSPGQLLLTLVPLDQVYVTANFKETQLEDVRPGQRAAIKADMYHKLEFEGNVDSIAGSSGSRQALLPPPKRDGKLRESGPADSRKDSREAKSARRRCPAAGPTLR